MDRRLFVSSVSAVSAVALSGRAIAHHGWSSFDESHPLYLVGAVKSVKWQNPHAEIALSMSADASLPSDLARRQFPQQSTPVDGAKILSNAVLPTKRGDWTLELAPLTRLEAWKVSAPKVGETIEAIGYTFRGEKGASIVRVEYLLTGGKIFGLRSMPV